MTFTVSDGSLSAAEVVRIAVTEVNAAPALGPIGNRTVGEGSLLSFAISGSDADLPANTLTYSAMGLPAGAIFDPATRTISWTPGESQGPGPYDVIFTVSDGSLSAAEVVRIAVTEVNAAPVLGPIGNRAVGEDSELRFTVAATDADLPANILTYSAMGLPAGATFDPATRTFTWTPGEAQDGSYDVTFRVSDGSLSASETITVAATEVNQAPVLGPIGNRTVGEGSLVSFAISGSDADLPANTLTYSAMGLPAGSSFDPATRTFSWTPSEAQDGVYDVTFTVSDGSLSAAEVVRIAVTEVNAAPVLGPSGSTSVDELTPISFNVAAADADLPANTLTYSATGLPAGATFDPAARTFSWTPTEAQGPGVYTFTVRVTDDGGPALFAGEQITVTVTEVNAAPVLGPIGNRTVGEGSELRFTIAATDADLPANGLTFSLVGAPSRRGHRSRDRPLHLDADRGAGPGHLHLHGAGHRQRHPGALRRPARNDHGRRGQPGPGAGVDHQPDGQRADDGDLHRYGDRPRPAGQRPDL